MRTRTAYLVLLALSAAGAARAPDAPPGVAGTWLDQSGRAGITIAPCGEKLCGSITWLRAPLDDQGHKKTDIHNSDTALQARPLCGLPILQGFSPDGANAWAGGTIYDPVKGSTYKSNMHLKPDGTLEVRGYIGFSFLGRSQTWTRPAEKLPPCG